jgi:hypothetical protein
MGNHINPLISLEVIRIWLGKYYGEESSCFCGIPPQDHLGGRFHTRNNEVLLTHGIIEIPYPLDV